MISLPDIIFFDIALHIFIYSYFLQSHLRVFSSFHFHYIFSFLCHFDIIFISSFLFLFIYWWYFDILFFILLLFPLLLFLIEDIFLISLFSVSIWDISFFFHIWSFFHYFISFLILYFLDTRWCFIFSLHFIHRLH